MCSSDLPNAMVMFCGGVGVTFTGFGEVAPQADNINKTVIAVTARFICVILGKSQAGNVISNMHNAKAMASSVGTESAT